MAEPWAVDAEAATDRHLREGDAEAALDLAGADASIVPVRELCERPQLLDQAQLAIVPGGFSHADALGAGRVFALSLALRLGDALRQFVAQGRPVLGICNGFQTLVRADLLPGALGHNASGQFQCDWVTLEPQPSHCVWTAGVEAFDCPIAHGEGRYVHADVAALEAAGQVALRYRVNPNGSDGDVAGVCDETGLVMGLMPHPENHIVPRQHPQFTRGHRGPLGLQVIAAGVRHVQELAPC